MASGIEEREHGFRIERRGGSKPGCDRSYQRNEYCCQSVPIVMDAPQKSSHFVAQVSHVRQPYLLAGARRDGVAQLMVFAAYAAEPV